MFVIRNFNGDYWNTERAVWVFKTRDATRYEALEEAQRDAAGINGIVLTIDPTKEAQEEKQRQRRNAARRARSEAARSVGVRRVRGNLGGIYWE